MKKNKMLKISAIFASLIYIIITSSNLAFAGTISSDINGINESKYPGCKKYIVIINFRFIIRGLIGQKL